MFSLKSPIMIEQVKKYLLSLENEICDGLEKIDSKSLFKKDIWSRDDGRGNGISRVISDGNIFEKI